MFIFLIYKYIFKVNIRGKKIELPRRIANKRRRKESNKEPRSVPLSNDPSQHCPEVSILQIIFNYQI